MMRGDVRLVRFSATVLLVVSASMAGLGAQAMRGMQGMGMNTGHGGPSAGMPMGQQMDKEFPPLVHEAIGKLALTAEQKRDAVSVLKDAAAKLTENAPVLQDAQRRLAGAKGEETKTAQRRVDLAFSERDLIVSTAETSLSDFLTSDQVDMIMAAAFHGVTKAHTGEMSMGGDTAYGMSELQNYDMRLMDMAGMMNADYKAMTLDLVIRELEAM